jgi:hypothetical protein
MIIKNKDAEKTKLINISLNIEKGDFPTRASEKKKINVISRFFLQSQRSLNMFFII